MNWRAATFCLAAALAGVALGRHITWSDAPVSGQTTPLPETPAPRWTPEDFLRTARERPDGEGFAGWSDGEISTALNAAIFHPQVALPQGAAAGLDGKLLGEWLRRDFDGAVAWYSGLESELVQARLAAGLSYDWPVEKADEGLAFLLAHKELFPSGIGFSILNKAMEHRAAAGPAALEAVIRELRENGMEPTFNDPISLPPGFDFAGFARGDEFQRLWDEGKSKIFVQDWHSQNRDGVFQWLLENHGAGTLGQITMNPKVDYPENLHWLGGKLGSLDASERSAFFASQVDWLHSPAMLVPLAEGVNDPAALEAIHRLGAGYVFAGRSREVLPLLETIPEPGRRVELLESAERPDAFAPSLIPAIFTDADETLLRQKLGVWGAAASRIDKIIQRFRQ